MDSEEANGGDEQESSARSHPRASFSMAQALSAFRQRQSEQQRAKEEEDKRLEEERKEKARAKRKRRRQNQKLAKAEAKAKDDPVNCNSESSEAVNQGDSLEAKPQHNIKRDREESDSQSPELVIKKKRKTQSRVTRKVEESIDDEDNPQEGKPDELTDPAIARSAKQFIPRALLLKQNKR